MKESPEYITPNHSAPAQGVSIPDINKSQFNDTSFSEINSLDKVRDILFGNQMREVDKKIFRLEERLVKECSDLRQDTRKRFDSLESYIKTEVESLGKQLKNEQIKSDDVVKRIIDDHKNITSSIEKKLVESDEITTNNQREMREQILNQSKNLHDDIRQKYEEILATLERESEELRHNKTDRSTLANLFTELAIRLNQL